MRKLEPNESLVPPREPSPTRDSSAGADSPASDFFDAPLDQSLGTPHLDTDDLLALADMNPADLAALMDASTDRTFVEVGSKVKGVVSRITKEYAFVDVGAKAEAILDRAELREGEGIGVEVEAFVLSAGEQGIQLSRKLTGSAAAAFLDDAVESGVPVEGRVVSRNKGGFEVQVGSVRAFCPISLIDRHVAEDLDSYLETTLSFQVLETGDKVVLSRRALQEVEAEVEREAFWSTAQVDDTHRGVVTSVQPFGVFVDLGGTEGLVHRSQLGWADDVDPTEAYHRGQILEVRIIRLDPDSRKVSLSAKDPGSSPWTRVGTEFVVGGVYEGTVSGVEVYGAFVSIAPGLKGLLHQSRRTSSAQLKTGQKIQVKLAGIDVERQRLELSDPDFEGSAPTASSTPTPRVAKDSGSIATFGDLFKGLKIK